MNIHSFLERIRFNDDVKINLETLNSLQTSFVRSVPFENLVIHLGQGIDFDSDVVFDKIVTRGRGGVCYENNTLFYDALLCMGFNARLIASEMNPNPQKEILEYTHVAILVDLDGKDYLVDVGNGRDFGGALPIDGSVSTFAEGFEYKIAQYDSNSLGLFVIDHNKGIGQKKGEWEHLPDNPEEWKVRYALEPELPSKTRSDFVNACHYIQTSPDSIFVQKRLATLPKVNSRITLSEQHWIEKYNDGQRDDEQVSDSEYLAVLKSKFGLDYQ